MWRYGTPVQRGLFQSGMTLIVLNIGGKVFNTSISTLRKSGPDSLLCKLIDNNADGTFEWTKDASGCFFIDRDPLPFEKILSFLRTGKLYLDEYVHLDYLLSEAEFYAVEPLLNILSLSRSPSGHELSSRPNSELLIPTEIVKPWYSNIKVVQFWIKKYFHGASHIGDEGKLVEMLEKFFGLASAKACAAVHQNWEDQWQVTVQIIDCTLQKDALRKLSSYLFGVHIIDWNCYALYPYTDDTPYHAPGTLSRTPRDRSAGNDNTPNPAVAATAAASSFS